MNELTPEELALLGAIAVGMQPIGGTQELKKLEELKLVYPLGIAVGKYVITVAGANLLLKREKVA